MKLYKTMLGFVIILLLVMTSSYSVIVQNDNNARAYFNFSNNGLDATGRFTTITATSSPFQVTGILGDAFNYDGTDNFDIVSVPVNTYPLTFNAWVKTNSSSGDQGVTAIGSSAANNQYIGLFVMNGFPTATTRNGAQLSATATTNISDGEWHMITAVMSVANNRRIYVDGVLEDTETTSVSFPTNNQFAVGQNADNQADQFFTGNIDEVSIWNKTLVVAEIVQLYNGGAAFGWNFTTAVPLITFDNVTINNIENFNNTFYNVSLVNLEVNLSVFNTNNLTNVTFFMYNSTGNLINTTQFITNTLNGDLDIVFPNEGAFKFFLNTTNNETSTLSPTAGNFTINFDITAPNLTVNLPSSYGFYDNFNFSNFINVSDTSLSSCVVTINNQTSTTCTNTSYSFQFNGNATINVTATDSAGNVNSSLNNIMLVNPLQNFFFQTNTGSPITSFTFGGLNFTTFANISTYNSIISLGNNTLLFEKLGFPSTNITFNLNTTSRINLTTNLSNSTIVIRIFDRETLILLNGTTTITLQATFGFNGTTTTGLLNISDINFISEQYQILAEHVGFGTENVFFNYNNQEIINIDIFMLNSSSPDAGTITIVVKNTLSQLVESAICSALEWRPEESAFMSVAQGLTNVNGETILNIELNTKIYKFSCTKQTFTTVTNAQVIQVDESILNIILNDIILIPTTLFPNLATSLTNSSINATHQLVTYTFSDADGLTTEGCLQSFFVNGNRQTFIQENCVSTSTGSLLLTVNINQTSDILMKGILTTPSVTDYVTDTLTFKGTGDIAAQFARLGLDVLIPTIFMLLGLGLGILMFNINVAVVLMSVGGWLGVALVPSIISGATAVFVTVIAGMMLWGGYTRK